MTYPATERPNTQNPPLRRAPFIVFEGGEGAGKTTQLSAVKSYLSDIGRDFVATREPGGTAGSEQLRSLLLQKDGWNWTSTSELLLMTAARVEHVERLIKPSLDDGKIVLCDRFVGSTIALQGGGGGVDIDTIVDLHRQAVGGFLPDLLILLDVDAARGLGHSLKRLGASTSAESRFEMKGIEYHRRVNQAYRDHSAKMGHVFALIDANRDLEQVRADVLQAVSSFLKRWDPSVERASAYASHAT